MAVNEIEMNTSTLAGDIESLEGLVNSLRSQMKKMFQSVEELDAMWDGPANAAFNQQFKADYKTCEEMCKTLTELIGSLRHAGEEYDKCEQNIDSMIRSIPI
ncbi:MAG: WXG100 family type VII secretion target [Lachnospiraceae bacterium]|nr:WXG100 family type VII secretion target [Lachnospiraceae bacterium]